METIVSTKKETTFITLGVKMENLGSKSKFLRSKKVLEIQGYLDKDVELSNQQ